MRPHRTLSRLAHKQTKQQKNQNIRFYISFKFIHCAQETLERYPSTLLGSQCREKYWEPERHAYVFSNRCRRSFESILYFYQSNGILSQPKNVLTNTFIEEVTFFKVCCRVLFRRLISFKFSFETFFQLYVMAPETVLRLLLSLSLSCEGDVGRNPSVSPCHHSLSQYHVNYGCWQGRPFAFRVTTDDSQFSFFDTFISVFGMKDWTKALTYIFVSCIISL